MGFPPRPLRALSESNYTWIGPAEKPRQRSKEMSPWGKSTRNIDCRESNFIARLLDVCIPRKVIKELNDEGDVGE